ncbi:hypothetical protein I4U23_025947 [Adineta vaga]|nr:hypothetical protein I4U23_025947 [Adineta vaga]
MNADLTIEPNGIPADIVINMMIILDMLPVIHCYAAGRRSNTESFTGQQFKVLFAHILDLILMLTKNKPITSTLKVPLARLVLLIMPHRTRSNSKFSFMKLHKSTVGKRVSRFFSKILWHFNQAVPNYSTRDNHRSKSYNRRVSIRHNHEQQIGINKNHNQIRRYSTRYRTCLIRQRHTTLMSIAEENENDEINCK